LLLATLKYLWRISTLPIDMWRKATYNEFKGSCETPHSKIGGEDVAN